MAKSHRSVRVFDVDSGVGRGEYADTVNDPDVTVDREATLLTKDGQVLRVVDMFEKTHDEAQPDNAVYTPPIC